MPNSCPIRRRTPVNQSQPQLTFRRTQGKPPWSQDPPDTSSKLVIRQTLLGRSTSQLRETGHGGGLVSVFVSVAFVRLRSPTLRSDPVMRAGREHARTTGKPGWKACWTDSNRDSNVAEKGPVGGEPVGTARAVNGLSWTVGQARPGPTDQKVSTAAKYSNDRDRLCPAAAPPRHLSSATTGTTSAPTVRIEGRMSGGCRLTGPTSVDPQDTLGGGCLWSSTG